MTDKVSIITPMYNAERFIKETIESVKKQTYKNWEMIIVDDGSSDDSVALVKNYLQCDSRLKLFCLDKNIGVAEARNFALSKVTGRFIAFLDHDDLWAPEKTEKQIGFMKKNNYAFSFTSYERISEDGTYVINVIPAPETIHYHDFLRNTIIGCLTVMLDREKVGEITFDNILSNDLSMWIKILKNFDAYGINFSLASHRQVKGSLSTNKLKTARSLWFIYRDIERLALPYSCFCFFYWMINALKKRKIFSYR